MGRLGAAAAAAGSVLGALVRTPRRVLVTLAGNSLLFRALPDVFARFADVLTDSAVLPFVLAVVSAGSREIRVVGALFGWTLLAYLVYQFLPRLLPDDRPAATVLGWRRVRLPLTALVCILAVPVSDQAPGIGASALPPQAVSVLGQGLFWWAVGFGGSLLLGLTLYAAWWRAASVDNRLAFFDQMTPGTVTSGELAAERESASRTGWTALVGSAVRLSGVVFVLMFVCLLFGLLAGMAGSLFPLPEVAVLLGVAGAALDRRRSGSRLSDDLQDRIVDVEARLYTVIQYTSTSRKGLTLAPVFAVGATLSILLTVVSFVAVGVFVAILVVRPDVFLTSRVGLVTRWNALGFLVCLAVPGVYSLWFWLRETTRIPHFLQYWEETHPGSASVVETDLPDLVARPPGALLLPTAFVALVSLFARIEPGTVALVPDLLFAVAWPATLVTTLLSVWWTDRAPPQHPRTEGYVLPLVFLLHLAWVWVLFDVLSEEFRPPPGVVVPVVVLGLATYYRPELRLKIESAVDRTRYSLLVEAVLFGGVFVVLGVGLRALGSPDAAALPAGVVLVGTGLVAFALLWVAHRVTQ